MLAQLTSDVDFLLEAAVASSRDIAESTSLVCSTAHYHGLSQRVTPIPLCGYGADRMMEKCRPDRWVFLRGL